MVDNQEVSGLPNITFDCDKIFRVSEEDGSELYRDIIYSQEEIIF